MDRPFLAENAESLRRLSALVTHLSDEELSLDLGSSWTVSAALAHLAFWDQRALALLRRWERDGVGRSPIDVDAVNDALLPLCRALPPKVAAGIAIESAEAVDRKLEQASPEMIAAIEGLAGLFRLSRAEHRLEHIRSIEQAVTQSRLG